MDALTDSRSLADRAYLRLRSEIIDGNLIPGDRLRAAELHKRFGLGLTPIREALMRLSTEGLVDAESRRGPRVMQASIAELADIMATRREIERLCLTRAIEYGDAAWEAEIVASLHVLSRTPLPDLPDDRGAAVQWEAQHRRFHFALVAACGSNWLLRFWNLLADHSERYRKIRLVNHRVEEAQVRDINAEHTAIMEAVVSRDSARANALMDTHLLATEKAVAQLFNSEAGKLMENNR